jgi:PII-like signaling protein
VFRGLEGFGGTAAIHKPHLIGGDAPLSVVIVDSEEKIQDLLTELEKIVGTAVMAVSSVRMRRVEKH